MKLTMLFASFGALIFCASTVALAPGEKSDFDLSWYTIDGGGGTSIGGSFELSGTIGQPDAGAVMTGGEFQLAGGFWPAAGEVASPCPADFDGDGDVDTADLLHLLGCWGTGCGDIDGDGDTDTADLLALLGAWGACP